MNTFHTLSEAFAELERQADAASADGAVMPAPSRPARSRSHLLPVAAGVIAVLTVAGGTGYLARGHSHTSPTAQRNGVLAAGAGSPTTASASFTREPFRIPGTPQELADRFRAVLAGSAIETTFAVTNTGAAPIGRPTPTSATPARVGMPPAPVLDHAQQPDGAAIVGTLTASGNTGGFDLQIFRAGTAGGHLDASCDDPDRARCTVRRLADGSSLAVGQERLESAANAVTYQVELIRPDGVEFLMHVSNERDPKGAGAVLAARPPLTTDQMTAILTSVHW